MEKHRGKVDPVLAGPARAAQSRDQRREPRLEIDVVVGSDHLGRGMGAEPRAGATNGTATVRETEDSRRR